jgi:hypothetical protein
MTIDRGMAALRSPLRALDGDEIACKNCGCPSGRRAFRTKDCCGKCAYLLQYLDEVQCWNPHKPETLEHIPKGGFKDSLVTDGLDKAEFAIWKDEHIRQIKSRLYWMRSREAKRRGEYLDGLTLERKFAAIQRAIRRRPQYPRDASYIRSCFNNEQLRVLFCLLDDIEEHVPVRRHVDIGKALDRISNYKHEMAGLRVRRGQRHDM